MNDKQAIIGNLLVILVVGYVFYWIWIRMDNTRFKIWLTDQWESIVGKTK